MAQDNNDILVDTDGDDLVNNGDWAVGDGTLDDCLIIMAVNSGVIKEDPIIGPNLQTMINSDRPDTDIKQTLRLNLARDGKEPTTLNVVNGEIDFEI